MRRLPRLGLVLLVLLVLSACAGEEDPGVQPADTSSGGSDTSGRVAGDHDLVLTLPDGGERGYLLHAPPAVANGEPLPLVLVLHGSGGSPEQMARITRFAEVADDEGFLVVYPTAALASDVPPLLDQVAEAWPVDGRRVFATGFSRGAATTYELTSGLAERIAAFAPVSGIFNGFAPGAPTSLLTIQGAEDDFAPRWREVNREWSRAAGCGTAVVTPVRFAARPAHLSVAECRGGSEHRVYDVERMGHAWPRQATRVIWEFFAAHPLD